MEREEMLNKLGKIKCLTTNMVGTFDMGFQFDVMTSKGSCTIFGNVGNWPCYKMHVSKELIELKKKLQENSVVSTEDILNVEVCKTLLSYDDVLQGEPYLISGDKLNRCIEYLKEAIKTLNTDQKEFYAYVDIEEFNENEIKFFSEYDELNLYFADKYGDEDTLYSDMSDDELEEAYNEAEENDFNGVLVKDYTE